MELKTQALDRVLEALSPALAAELDRVVAETRQTLEEELQKRLEIAVRDAEQNTKAAADAQMANAVAETEETTKKQVTAELEEKFQTKLAETIAQLQTEASAERSRLQEQVDQWRTFAETQRQLAEASSQPEILARFLKIAQPFAAGLGLYVTKADGLALWKHRGNGAFPEIISQQTTDPESYFKAVVVRDKIVAAVCALPPFRSDALDFLTWSLERAIEVFGLKLRAPVPKPVIASETTTAVRQSAAPAAETAAAAAATRPAEAREADDPQAHANARRIARLLVSEIKLYHERELKEGRDSIEVYDRLQKQIELGRQAYTDQVLPSVLTAHDYFHEELVRILGENDPRMGRAYPGPVNS
jgi:hypothetical protein